MNVLVFLNRDAGIEKISFRISGTESSFSGTYEEGILEVNGLHDSDTLIFTATLKSGYKLKHWVYQVGNDLTYLYSTKNPFTYPSGKDIIIFAETEKDSGGKIPVPNIAQLDLSVDGNNIVCRFNITNLYSFSGINNIGDWYMYYNGAPVTDRYEYNQHKTSGKVDIPIGNFAGTATITIEALNVSFTIDEPEQIVERSETIDVVGAPGIVRCTDRSNNGYYDFEWDGIDGVDSYQLRATIASNTSAYFEWETDEPLQRVYLDELLYGITHNLQVRAYKKIKNKTIFSVWTTATTFTTNPSQPSITDYEVDKDSIVGTWEMNPESDFTTVSFYLYSSDGSLYKIYTCEKTDYEFVFEELPPDTYTLKGESCLTVNSTDLFSLIRPRSIIIKVGKVVEKWSWTTDELDAFNNHGNTTTLTYDRWNELVEKVSEILDGSWDTKYATLADTKMSSTDKTLTAVRFNSLTYNINNDSTGIGERARGNIVYGSYFITISDSINSWIGSL